MPYLGILAQGEARERTLITPAQANEHLPKGVYEIDWTGPSALLFPPGSPHAIMHRDRADELGAPARWSILWIRLWSEMLLHTQIKEPGSPPRVSHNLQVGDPRTLALANLFVEELRAASPHSQEAASAILLAMILRLRDVLASTPVGIANTSRGPLPGADQESVPGSAAASREAAMFIQMRLHEVLTLDRVAAAVGLSAPHLNRVFRRHYGVSVIRHVRQQRVEAAKKILADGAENISEIASLVGFKRASLFCEVFQRETGLTPGEFRRRARLSK